MGEQCVERATREPKHKIIKQDPHKNLEMLGRNG